MTIPADKEIVQSIRGRFQFLGVLTFFFPATLQPVFSAFQEAVEINKMIMSWGGHVYFLLIS